MIYTSDNPFSPFSFDESLIEEARGNIIHEFERQDCAKLMNLSQFKGAGVYAIYYFGDFSAYALLSQQNVSSCILPIYTGKSIPEGGRKGLSVNENQTTTKLYHRLNEHKSSIVSANNLRIEDFSFRYLVVEDIFIEFCERVLIQTYKPVWNAHVDGFGNHTPGAMRFKGQRAGWDEIHPGRSWSHKYEQSNTKTIDEWILSIQLYLSDLLQNKVGDVEEDKSE